VPTPDGAWLDQYRACFVTLRSDGALRGCVGSILPRRALRDDVAANARAAAFADPRFPALAPDELVLVRLEVSVLSTPSRITFRDRDDLIARLEPFVDGLVLGSGPRSATFLPQVWESLPDPADFIDALVRKAGLAPGTTLQACKVERYRVRKWSEDDDTLASPLAADAGVVPPTKLEPFDRHGGSA
jgi:AmmeMemoRadiSam system protein A